MCDRTPLTLADVPTREAIRSSTGEPLGLVADLSNGFGLSALRAAREVLLPGRRSAPAHAHSHTEELIVVLSGCVTVRFGSEEVAVLASQTLGFPTGGPAHEVINTSDEPAVLLTVAAVHPDDEVTFAA